MKKSMQACFINKVMFLLFFIASVSYGQNTEIEFDLFIDDVIYSENDCIDDDFSSAILKQTSGDVLDTSSVSLSLLLDGTTKKDFSAYIDFNNFNLEDWLLSEYVYYSQTTLRFSFRIQYPNGAMQTIIKKYCVNLNGGNEVLLVGAGNEVNYVTLPIFFATDREYTGATDFEDQFGSNRSRLKYGLCEISIPNSHQVGEIESPSYWRFEFWENPNKHIVIQSIEMLRKDNYFEKLSERIRKSPKKSAFLFVHGFNVTFIEAAKRTAQMTYDLEFEGESVFYSWPSRGKSSAYTVDEATIEWSKLNIEHFLKDFLSKTDAEEIYLIAHSMGNRGLTRAIISVMTDYPELKEKIKEVILAAPDIDADVFKRDIAPKMVSKLKRPITLYVSSDDIALKASRIVHGNPRAGDSKEFILVVDGVETIDASGIDTSFLGHSYFTETPSILEDILDIIKTARRASLRAKLVEVIINGAISWKVKRN